MARRKQTDQTERRTATVTFQVTPTERAELDERAAAGGVTVSEYVRAAAFGFRITRKEPVDEATLRELWAAGNNLNQLARRANTTEEIDQQELSDALRHWRKAVERLEA
jgi:hypothetical protein